MAQTVAHEEGLSDIQAGKTAIVATEAATNLWKHAQSGEIQISPLSERFGPGVEILSIDRGPGIANLDQCLADGYSSSGTPGTGIGAMMRLSQVFDAYSEPGKGTVLVAQLFD